MLRIVRAVRIQRREFCSLEKVRFVLCLEGAFFSHFDLPSTTSAACYFLPFHMLLSLPLHPLFEFMETFSFFIIPFLHILRLLSILLQSLSSLIPIIHIFTQSFCKESHRLGALFFSSPNTVNLQLLISPTIQLFMG